MLVVVLTSVALLCAIMEVVSPDHLSFHNSFRELYPAGTISEWMIYKVTNIIINDPLVLFHLLSAAGHVLCYAGSIHR